jgi:hypothetical protein
MRSSSSAVKRSGGAASRYDQVMAAGIRRAQLMVGMEVHVELATHTKMFTRAASVAHPDNFDAPPNSLVDSMVMALPGALPVMNKAAIEMSIMVGLALNCEIAKFSKWDRKNYFYPDLPKGYQISQYDLPLCFDGELDIHSADGATKKIGIIRAHLEEDTGKLGHELPGGHHYEGSLVDLNRAGTPLLEIVTEPDLTSADDAVTFAQELSWTWLRCSTSRMMTRHWEKSFVAAKFRRTCSSRQRRLERSWSRPPRRRGATSRRRGGLRAGILMSRAFAQRSAWQPSGSSFTRCFAAQHCGTRASRPFSMR